MTTKCIQEGKTYVNTAGSLVKCVFVKGDIAYFQYGEVDKPMVLYSCNKNTGAVFPPLFSNIII